RIDAEQPQVGESFVAQELAADLVVWTLRPLYQCDLRPADASHCASADPAGPPPITTASSRRVMASAPVKRKGDRETMVRCTCPRTESLPASTGAANRPVQSYA